VKGNQRGRGDLFDFAAASVGKELVSGVRSGAREGTDD